jgi:ATP synthase protein I
MSEEPDYNQKRDPRQKMMLDIEGKQKRKIKARKNQDSVVWFGLGMIGMVGWTVVLPSLLGLALGFWIDSVWPGPISWTFVLMIGGVVFGCFNAVLWLMRELKNIEDENRENQDDIE